MGALGTITVPSSGSLAAPTDALDFALASAASTVLPTGGVFDVAPLSALKGILFANGRDAMRHALGASWYRTGLLPPSAVQTLAASGSGARATATLTCGSNVLDGAKIRVGHPQRSRVVTLESALVVDGSGGDQVLVGANLTATMANYVKFLNGTGTHGVEYFNHKQWLGQKVYLPSDLSDAGVEGTASDATTATTRVVTWGTEGNSYIAEKISGANITSYGTSSKFSGGAAGTSTAPKKGIYRYARTYYRSVDGAQSDLSSSATYAKSNDDGVNQTDFVDPAARYDADYHRWYRSLVSGSQFYRGKDIATADAEPYVDTVSDDTIKDAFALIHDFSQFRPYRSGPPPSFRCVTEFKGSLVGAGAILAADYAIGTADVTNGSATVTLSAAARPMENWIGRVFTVSGHTREYVVVAVTESSRVLTLNIPYEGSTSGTATYRVRDARDPFELHWTPPGFPNNWPPTFSQKGVSSEDPAGVLAIQAVDDSVLLWTRTGLWRAIGESIGGARAFRIVPIAPKGMGCFGPRCVAVVRGVVYWAGPDGVFAYEDGAVLPLSSPPVEKGKPLGIHDTIQSINVEAAEGACSVYDATTKRVRWFVPIDGDRNRHAILYDLQTHTFTRHRTPEITACASVANSDGTTRIVGGDSFGVLLEFDRGTSDGAYGFECTHAVLTYTASTLTLTVTGTPFPTSGAGLCGVPVWHVDSSGNFQRNTIASNTSSALVFARPWGAAPAVASTIVVGGICLDIETGDCEFQSAEALKTAISTVVSFTPSSAGRLWCGAAFNTNDPKVRTGDYADLTRTKGEYEFWHRKGQGARLSWRIVDVVPGHEVSIHGWIPRIGISETVMS